MIRKELISDEDDDRGKPSSGSEKNSLWEDNKENLDMVFKYQYTSTVTSSACTGNIMFLY